MTDAEVVLRKLSVLEDHLRRARRRRPASADDLVADQDLQDALAMSLLVCIQEAADIAFHIAVDEGLGLPGSNAEAFEALARNGIITPDLARAMGSAVGLRNRLAHGYATLDIPRLWAELPAGLDAIDRYVRAIGELLRNPPSNA
jgi:uncharacterized protein YutE (UPF0331/DUF86 family)